MARFLVCMSTLVALCNGAPSYGVGYGQSIHAVPHPHAHVSEEIIPGPAVHHKIPITGVVGHEAVQVGSQSVVTGHEYVQAGEERIQPPSVTYPAGVARDFQETNPLPLPPVPSPTQTFSAPIIEGKVSTYRNDNALGRRKVTITPQQTIVKPELQVNEVPYDVPVHVPVPVERTVLVDKPVLKPFTVEVPTPVAVPQPFKVHPVKKIVKTPVVHKHTVIAPAGDLVSSHGIEYTGAHGVYPHAHEAAYAGAYAHGVGYDTYPYAHGAALSGAYAHGAALSGTYAHGAALSGAYAHGAGYSSAHAAAGSY